MSIGSSRVCRLVLVISTIAFSSVGAPARALSPEESRQASTGLASLDASQVEDAERIAASLTTHANEPLVRALDGTLAFYRGAYDQAVTDLERALPGLRGRDLESTRALLEIARGTAEATRGFVESRSSDGRYVVKFREGRDRLLVAYALDTMRREDEALTSLLGHRLPGPIRLEVYANAAELAKVSTLSEEAIERTGTIALCKWNKLMITSPAALARGYPWSDTIAHELVHLHLSHATRDRAPVWMQEGFAKYLERAYRGAPSLRLSPPEASLFARKLHDNALLPFDAFHPSIALLPSQTDAALAFAEVSTLVAAFHRAHGDAGLRQVVTSVASGVDARKAFGDVVGMAFASYEQRVFDEVRRATPRPSDEPRLLPRRFTRGGVEDDVVDVSQSEAARRVRLGDMLWSRGRAAAASVEYAKAHDLAPHDAIVGSRMGRSALEGGRFAEAVRVSRQTLADYPNHAPAHAALAAGLDGTGDRGGAYRAAVEAIRENPFDPLPHCVVGRVSESPDERQRESDACRTLGGEGRLARRPEGR